MGFYIKAKFMGTEIFYQDPRGNETPYPLGQEEWEDLPISLFVDSVPTEAELRMNKYNILMIMEPNEYFGLHTFAMNNHNHFTCILTWDKEILDNCDNALLFLHGLSWLKKDYVDKMEMAKKEFEVSYLCGGKRLVEGHFVRHKLYNRGNEITIPRKWFYTLKDNEIGPNGNYMVTDMAGKNICWDKSMFHIAIENISRDNFFTEKILDAFLTKTIPIYYGCKNINEYFYADGVYQCKNENEIIEVCNSLTEQDYYDKIDIVNANYELAKSRFNWSGMLKEWLEMFIEQNEIRG